MANGIHDNCTMTTASTTGYPSDWFWANSNNDTASTDGELGIDYWDGEQWRDLYEPKRVQGLDYRNCPNCSQMYPLEDFVGGCPRCGAPYMVEATQKETLPTTLDEMAVAGMKTLTDAANRCITLHDLEVAAERIHNMTSGGDITPERAQTMLEGLLEMADKLNKPLDITPNPVLK